MNFAIVPIFLASISSGMSKDLPPAVLNGGFTSFQTPLPRSVQSWEKRRVELRRKLRRLLVFRLRRFRLTDVKKVFIRNKQNQIFEH